MSAADTIGAVIADLYRDAARFDSIAMERAADRLSVVVAAVRADEEFVAAENERMREYLSTPFPIAAWLEIGRLMDAGEGAAAS